MSKYVWKGTNEDKFQRSTFTGSRETALELGYVEVSDADYEKLCKHEKCWKDGELVNYTKTAEENAKEQAMVQRKEKLAELHELEKWFDGYDLQVKQYIRCERMGIEFDKDIAELDNQAQANAVRINELRSELQ